MSTAVARYAHSGICVSDSERSKQFYANVLGFTEGPMPLDLKNQFHGLLGVDSDPVDLHSIFLRLGGLIIELLHFREPETLGPSGPRPMYQLGLTHLSFNVDDMDATIAAVEQWGGALVEKSRSTFELPHMTGEIVFVTDPDGTRIELFSFPEDVVMA